VEPLLRSDRTGVLEATWVLDVLRTRYPEQFHAGQARALQRRCRDWRARHGVEPEVFFEPCETVLRQRAVVDTARSTTQQRRAQARRPDAATETLAAVSGTHAIAEVDYSDLPGYPVEEWPS
jgi:hypothetical protein